MKGGGRKRLVAVTHVKGQRKGLKRHAGKKGLQVHLILKGKKQTSKKGPTIGTGLAVAKTTSPGINGG